MTALQYTLSKSLMFTLSLTMIDYEEMALESNLFPWLDSDCMSDDFFDELSYFEDEEDFE